MQRVCQRGRRSTAESWRHMLVREYIRLWPEPISPCSLRRSHCGVPCSLWFSSRLLMFAFLLIHVLGGHVLDRFVALDKSAMGGRAYGVRACVLKLLLQQLNGSHVTLMYRTIASRDLNVSAAQGVVCKAQNPGQRAQPWSVCVYGFFFMHFLLLFACYVMVIAAAICFPFCATCA